LPDFCDRRLYDTWINTTGSFLAFDRALGISVPRSLGGQKTPDNLIVDDMLSYYPSTGRVYAGIQRNAGSDGPGPGKPD
jgi:hypothetical protein